MKKTLLLLVAAAAATQVPSSALARGKGYGHQHSGRPPLAAPPQSNRGKAIVNAACTFPDGCATAIVTLPATPPDWLKNGCFYLTDVTITNSDAANRAVGLAEGTSGAAKLLYNVATNATLTQAFQTPVYFSGASGLFVKQTDGGSAAANLSVAVSGFWENCPAN